MVKINHVIYFTQSQLPLAKTNEDRTASRNGPLSSLVMAAPWFRSHVPAAFFSRGFWMHFKWVNRIHEVRVNIFHSETLPLFLPIANVQGIIDYEHRTFNFLTDALICHLSKPIASSLDLWKPIFLWWIEPVWWRHCPNKVKVCLRLYLNEVLFLSVCQFLSDLVFACIMNWILTFPININEY